MRMDHSPIRSSFLVFANRGPELSRALRGLPFCISLKTHGATKFGQMVDKNMAQSRLVEGLVRIVLT